MMQIHLTLKYFILMLETLSYNLNKKKKILTEEEAKVSKITNQLVLALGMGTSS